MAWRRFVCSAINSSMKSFTQQIQAELTDRNPSMLELECGEERDICQAPDSVSTQFSSLSSRWRQKQIKSSSGQAKLLLIFLQMKFSRICKEVLRSWDPKRTQGRAFSGGRARSQDPHGIQEWQQEWGWVGRSQSGMAGEPLSSEQGKKPHWNYYYFHTKS